MPPVKREEQAKQKEIEDRGTAITSSFEMSERNRTRFAAAAGLGGFDPKVESPFNLSQAFSVQWMSTRGFEKTTPG